MHIFQSNNLANQSEPVRKAKPVYGGPLVDLAASAFGLGSCLLTGLTLWLVAKMTGFAIHKFTFWMVFPLGAILAGGAGASGFYVGYHRVFKCRPGRLLLVNILACSIGTFSLIYYLSFVSFLVRFPVAAGIISFWTFLDASIRAGSIEIIGGPSTGKLGYLGYVTTSLEVLGFCCGGIAVYVHLHELLYCKRCGRLVDFVDEQVRYSLRNEEMIVIAGQVAAAFGANDPVGGLRLHAEFGIAAEPKDGILRSVSSLYACEHCGCQKVVFAVEHANGPKWTPLPGSVFEASSDSPLAVSRE